MNAGRSLSLKARALKLLAQREHSRAELRAKLLRAARPRKGLPLNAQPDDGQLSDAADPADADELATARAAEVDELLDWLVAHRYLDESRFVESRVNARAGRFGLRRIQGELARHGVELDASTASALRASEWARARDVWLRRFGHPPVDATESAKQMRFLAGRGFSAEVIRGVVRGDDEPD